MADTPSYIESLQTLESGGRAGQLSDALYGLTVAGAGGGAGGVAGLISSGGSEPAATVAGIGLIAAATVGGSSAVGHAAVEPWIEKSRQSALQELTAHDQVTSTYDQIRDEVAASDIQDARHEMILGRDAPPVDDAAFLEYDGKRHLDGELQTVEGFHIDAGNAVDVLDAFDEVDPAYFLTDHDDSYTLTAVNEFYFNPVGYERDESNYMDHAAFEAVEITGDGGLALDTEPVGEQDRFGEYAMNHLYDL